MGRRSGGERWTERLRGVLAQRRAKRAEAARVADALEARWRERRRDVEALERMRERAHETWLKEKFIREEAESDEATLARVARNLKESDEPVDAGRESVLDVEGTR